MTADQGLLEAAIDQLGTGLLVTAADGTVVAANRAGLALLDLPADAHVVGEPVDTVLRGGSGAFPGDLGGQAAGGRWSPRPGLVVEWTWSELLPGTPAEGRCLILRDVSHRLADRARVRRQNRALAELVA